MGERKIKSLDYLLTRFPKYQIKTTFLVKRKQNNWMSAFLTNHTKNKRICCTKSDKYIEDAARMSKFPKLGSVFLVVLCRRHLGMGKLGIGGRSKTGSSYVTTETSKYNVSHAKSLAK